MNAKLIVEGKEFDIEILDPQLQELLKPKANKTGYERAKSNDTFYVIDSFGEIIEGCREDRTMICDKRYNVANYYSDKDVAADNARADKLMRQLRRFAVRYRKEEIDYLKGVYEITYDFEDRSLITDTVTYRRYCGAIPFDSKETAERAIDTFRDELIWYFTEYKDSL